MKLRSGELNKRITIQRQSGSVTERGTKTRQVVEVASAVPAAVKPIKVSEDTATDKEIGQADTEFWIRYRKDVVAGNQVVYQEQIYDVLGVIEIGFNEGLRLVSKAKRMGQV